MTDTDKTLTTGDLSKKTGLSVSTITQMLRDGRIRGEKRSGKWAIHPGESNIVMASMQAKKPAAPVQPAHVPSPATKEVFEVKAFAEITYLTEQGVRQWLRCGRLSGTIDPDGNPTVDAANLDRPELKHLLRH